MLEPMPEESQTDFNIPESVVKDPKALSKLLSGIKAHIGILDGQITVYQKQAYHNKMLSNMMKELQARLTKNLDSLEAGQQANTRGI